MFFTRLGPLSRLYPLFITRSLLRSNSLLKFEIDLALVEVHSRHNNPNGPAKLKNPASSLADQPLSGLIVMVVVPG